MKTLEAARFLLFGPFRFDPVNRLLLKDGVELALPPRVLAVLECLLERPGAIIPRQEIIERVWRDAFVTDTSLAEAISFLRQTLGDDPQSPSYIQTLHRRGYRFVAPITREPETPPDVPAVTPAVPGGTSESERLEAGPSIPGALVPWSLVLLLGAVAAVALWRVTHPVTTNAPRVARFEVALPAGAALRTDRQSIAMSPDGAVMAFAGCDGAGCRLYVRDLAALAARALAGTEDAAAPFFSPDGNAIGFFAAGKLKRVAVAGGAPVVLCDAPDILGGTWLDDGRIVFAAHEAGGLEIVGESGGTPSPYTRVDARSGDVGHRWPHWIPGSEHVIFTAIASPDPAVAPRAMVVSRASGATQALSARASGARFLARDLVLFARGPELYAARFEPRLGSLSTAPARVSMDVRVASDGGPVLATSSSGAILHAIPGGRPVLQVARGPRFDRTAALDGPSTDWSQLQLEPAGQGQRLAGISRDGARSELWVADLNRGTTTRVVHEREAAVPRWMPDGRSLVFSASGGGPYNLWRVEADTGEIRPLSEAPRHQFASHVSASGAVVFTEIDDTAHGDIWLLDASGARAPLVRSRFDERGGVLSPDGRFLAYESDESGLRQMYVKRVDRSARHVVSASEGSHAWWLPDRRLMYANQRGLWELTVGADGAPGVPRLVFDSPAAEVVDGSPGAILLRQREAGPSSLRLTLEAWQEISRGLPPAVTPLPR